MTMKFKDKYRIESVRMRNWDYGSNASYFVTICTQNRECYFGDIINGTMEFSGIGTVANNCWLQIPEHFPFVKLGEHIIMPNHIHGIIIIDKPDDTIALVETRLIASLPMQPPQSKTGGFAGNKNPMLNDNLSRIVRWYKGRTSFESRKIHAEFAWQPRFHDHIIRGEKSFDNISNYIANNPLNWNKGKDVLNEVSAFLSVSIEK